MNLPIDPSALLNLWNLEELSACNEGMEHARAFLTSAGEAVSSIENHDPRLLLREFVVLFRIFAAHSATRFKRCHARMTAELFREILDYIEGDIETRFITHAKPTARCTDGSAMSQAQRSRSSLKLYRTATEAEPTELSIRKIPIPESIIGNRASLCCI
jgi:hypothetical protein